MKKNMRVAFSSAITLLVVGVAVGPAASQQSPLPRGITASLAQREQDLSDLTFDGNMAVKSQVAPDPPEIIAQLQRSIKRSDQQEFAQSHGASSHDLSKTISQHVASMADVGKGWEVASVHEWQITRSGSQLLAVGDYQDSPNVTGTYSQYYRSYAVASKSMVGFCKYNRIASRIRLALAA